jgi:hypothetical protein
VWSQNAKGGLKRRNKKTGSYEASSGERSAEPSSTKLYEIKGRHDFHGIIVAARGEEISRRGSMGEQHRIVHNVQI